MSPFLSGWIIFHVILNLGIALFLFLWGQRVKIPTQPDGTSGHVWAHGVLREGVRKLPLWWVLLSATMFTLCFVHLTLYPGFGSYPGELGWTSHGELAADASANRARLDPELQSFAARPVEQLADDSAALRIGHRLFVDNCSACHGFEGGGNPLIGAPNLADTEWLYGGDGDTILRSILDGRHGIMPPMIDAVGGPQGVKEVANFVRQISDQEPYDEELAALGKEKFAVCAACHGPEGKGNPALGAPNLTDDVWLYGGHLATVEKTIRDGRGGVMPAWRQRLSEGEAHAVAAWVYKLSPHENTGH